MRVFWSVGYDPASIDLLSRETGMPRASLYRDFGGKEGLFLAAIAHYGQTRMAPVAAALGPRFTLAVDLAAFFEAVVTLATRDATTPGCLISCVLADVAAANARFRQELDRRFSLLEERIAQRLSLEAAPDTAPDTVPDSRALAGMLAAVARGITLRARSGAPARDLRAVAECAVRSATALRT